MEHSSLESIIINNVESSLIYLQAPLSFLNHKSTPNEIKNMALQWQQWQQWQQFEYSSMAVAKENFTWPLTMGGETWLCPISHYCQDSRSNNTVFDAPIEMEKWKQLNNNNHKESKPLHPEWIQGRTDSDTFPQSRRGIHMCSNDLLFRIMIHCCLWNKK